MGQGTPARMSKDFDSTDRRALGVHAVLIIYASETVTSAKNTSIYLPVNLARKDCSAQLPPKGWRRQSSENSFTHTTGWAGAGGQNPTHSLSVAGSSQDCGWGLRAGVPGEKARGRCIAFSNLRWEIMQHQICHILVIRNRALGPTRSQRKRN